MTGPLVNNGQPELPRHLWHFSPWRALSRGFCGAYLKVHMEAVYGALAVLEWL
jgi:hypothetical protein